MCSVDVIIPCYKYGAYLRKCVESVLTQQGVGVRALILDDASPDSTPEVAAELAREDSRVAYRRHRTNQGHINTYNEGLLEWASADYVLLLSADDLLAPGALLRAARVMDEHPEVVLTHGRQAFFTEVPDAEEPAAVGGEARAVIASGADFIAACCAVAHNPVATPTAVVRTAAQRAVGGYGKHLPHSADLELWLRFAARGAVAHIPALQAYKRRHEANMQHQYLTTALADVKERAEAFDSFFARDGRLVPCWERLQALAGRRLAEAAFWAASHAFDRGDVSGCEICLEFARARCPELTLEGPWRRLRWKRRLGHRIWRLLGPVRESVRRLTRRPAAAPGTP